MSALRSLRRGVAKNRMKRAGMVKFCKHGHVGHQWQRSRLDSTFSKEWRSWVG